jgi:hypothetical protein
MSEQTEVKGIEDIKGLLRMQNNFLYKIFEKLEEINNTLKEVKNGLQFNRT